MRYNHSHPVNPVFLYRFCAELPHRLELLPQLKNPRKYRIDLIGHFLPAH